MTFVPGFYLECKTKKIHIVAIAALTDMVFMVFDGLSVAGLSKYHKIPELEKKNCLL